MPRKKRVFIPAGVEDILDNALDKALTVQRPVVQRYLERVRRRHLDDTPAQVVARLEKMYRRSVVGIGAASGGTAALPGVGTAASVATGAAEIAAFVSATATYVLGLADIYGVPTHDPEVRRALVLATVLGEGSLPALDSGTAAANRGKHWAQIIGMQAGRAGDDEKLKTLNNRLTRMVVTHWGAQQGALMFGRALPFGIGAGIGAAGNAALAQAAIKAARRAFGPAPDQFAPKIIDV